MCHRRRCFVYGYVCLIIVLDASGSAISSSSLSLSLSTLLPWSLGTVDADKARADVSCSLGVLLLCMVHPFTTVGPFRVFLSTALLDSLRTTVIFKTLFQNSMVPSRYSILGSLAVVRPSTTRRECFDPEGGTLGPSRNHPLLSNHPFSLIFLHCSFCCC